MASVTESGVVERCVTECQAVFHLASAVGVRLVVEEPGRSPIAWQGSQLSRLIAETAAGAER